MREHVRHRKAVALVEPQSSRALLVVPGLADNRLDFEQLRHVAVALADMREDARAVARAAHGPVHREEAQVEQVRESEGESQGDHVAGPVLARREGGVDPGKEIDLVAHSALRQLGKGDLLLGREGTLVDFLDCVGDRTLVGHGNRGEVGHGTSLLARPVASGERAR